MVTIAKIQDHSNGGLLLICSSFMLSRQRNPYLVDIQSSISLSTQVFSITCQHDRHLYDHCYEFHSDGYGPSFQVSVVCTPCTQLYVQLLPTVFPWILLTILQSQVIYSLTAYKAHHSKVYQDQGCVESLSKVYELMQHYNIAMCKRQPQKALR